MEAISGSVCSTGELLSRERAVSRIVCAPRALYGSPFHAMTTDAVLCARYHDPEATLEEGLDTLRRCIDEVSKRLVVSPGKYKVKIVDKDGVREIEL